MAAKKKPAKKPTKKKPTKKSKPAAKAASKPTKATKKPAKKPAKKKVGFLPKGYSIVTPTMNQTDANATIAFCQKVFGAKVRLTMPGPDGKLTHAEITVGNAVIMLSDSVMEPARVASIFVYVPDVDKTLAAAVDAGSSILMPAMDMFWGDRFARFADPFGNLWAIATHVEDVTPAKMKKRQQAEMARMAAAGASSAQGSDPLEANLAPN